LDIRGEIRDAPRALRHTLEKGRPEFESLVRGTRWGDGPLFILGSGPSYPAALAGLCAFESLLGWPVVVSRAANFLAYSASLIRPRSVVLAVSLSGEADKTLEAALQARSRGAALLALTASPTSPLAEAADGTFLVRPGEELRLGLQSELCLFAAVGFVALVAARVLKRHHHKLDELEAEYEKLPDHSEWVLTQLTDAARSLASRLRDLEDLVLVGGGSYYPAAMQAAETMARLTPLRPLAQDAVELPESLVKSGARNRATLFLSGSRCRVKKEIHESARLLGSPERFYAVTDSNDQDLRGAASLAVLLPSLGEMTGSALELLFFQFLISQLLQIIKSSMPSAR
jgi:glucosamine 6-phosphate synthetase-like amidotransferase/phosphosugar isomerase protein